MKSERRIQAVAAVFVVSCIGCAREPERIESRQQAITPTENTDQLRAKACEQALGIPNESHPHITVYNS